MAERRTRNAQVKGSIPLNGSKRDLLKRDPFSFPQYSTPRLPGLSCLRITNMGGKGSNINIRATHNHADALAA